MWQQDRSCLPHTRFSIGFDILTEIAVCFFIMEYKNEVLFKHQCYVFMCIVSCCAVDIPVETWKKQSRHGSIQIPPGVFWQLIWASLILPWWHLFTQIDWWNLNRGCWFCEWEESRVSPSPTITRHEGEQTNRHVDGVLSRLDISVGLHRGCQVGSQVCDVVSLFWRAKYRPAHTMHVACLSLRRV